MLDFAEKNFFQHNISALRAHAKSNRTAIEARGPENLIKKKANLRPSRQSAAGLGVQRSFTAYKNPRLDSDKDTKIFLC